MKKIITAVAFLTLGFANAQAFKGKGDIKAQVGTNLQDGGSGIVLSSDFGIGENMSYGFVATYLLNDTSKDAKFSEKSDFKVRFNANIGNVFGLSSKMDIYPGLDLSLKNFGTHLGFRYFFTDGFGLYTEAGIPIAKYDDNVVGFENYHNQFYTNIGISFNL